MLYLDFAQNREDFILEKEEKYPYWIQKIICFWRKTIGQPIIYELEGKKVILISKFNKKIAKRLNKIFQVDVTRTVCVCEQLCENQEFMNYLKEKNLNIMDGKWLFHFLTSQVAEFICQKYGLVSEEQEISILINNPTFLVFEIIQRLSLRFKSINIVTNALRKFDKLQKELYEKNGFLLNVTNNYKSACLKSKMIFNFDFEEKELNKIRFLPDMILINLKHYVDVKQSNFKGENIDFYTVGLPTKYRKVYKKLRNFNSSILYESFIYKKTSNQNIWNEIEKDKLQILCLEKR